MADPIGIFLTALSPVNVGLAFLGVLAGTVIGALPGLSATMAIAVLVPFTFVMDPASGLIMLGAIYTGAIYGGAFAAILVNTPGTPSAIATTFDGFPMAKRGDGDLAVTLATIASVVGGLVGAILLMTLSPRLATLALAFQSTEYFWLAILGLTLIATLSQGNVVKGMIGGMFGLFLSMIGVAVIGGDVRFTGGMPLMLGGIDIVAALIGLYCIPVLIGMVAGEGQHLEPAPARGFRLFEALGIALRDWVNLLRSSLIGTLVGILPGAGGSIASLISYAEARRASPRAEAFGKGEPGGLLATESANNATVGGGFIPTLVLGIPGTPPDAVIMGALMVQGIRTGPALFQSGDGTVYVFMTGLLVATLLMLPTGLVVGRYAFRFIANVPKAMLVPLIAYMTIVGSFAIHANPHDVLVMVVMGLIGWTAARGGYGASPIVLGLVLGQIAEQGFMRAWMIGGARGDFMGQLLLNRPISWGIVALIAATLCLPLLRRRRQGQLADVAPRQGGDVPGLVGALVFLGLAVWMILQASRLGAMAAAFPLAVAVVLAVLSVVQAVRSARGGPAPTLAPPSDDATGRGLVLGATMLGWALLFPHLGMFTTSILACMILTLTGQFGRLGLVRLCLYAMGVLIMVGAFYLLMVRVLNIPMPTGLLP
ncbi:tripartite tricarboxylate transporter permease [Paracoccus sp. 1_MG-2023]|uniref:tripartite tricarboxylate transporter permease n=1 Tax=unclassified Paracoccus (in: a-proteobacteria) TaxID=2688777 RepID=UPI001C09CF8A|nr:MULTISPECIES: tripartite tricarboxylate transporter permease [unclassified Paracoccus (in: a-proteobacteria)]MBU2957887.1 tripartite tricarboxylate transporter permease [Paracoccus sp. C2R09]MDO6668920.1 tripartite tricarboxylate transporter permease [Paracoccus sp. 1_MG-2023]